MASTASQKSRSTHEPLESSPGPLRIAWNNSQELLRTLGVSIALHIAVVGAALAYVPAPVEQPDTAQATSAAFEEVTIPADLYAAIVGEPELAGDDEEANLEPEAPAEEAASDPEPASTEEPTVAQPVESSPPLTNDPTPENIEPTREEPEAEQVVQAPDPELESPIEPIETDDPAPDTTTENLIAEATPTEEEAEATQVGDAGARAHQGETGASSNHSNPTRSATTRSSAAERADSGGTGEVDRGLLNAHRRRLSRAMQGENQCPREAIRQRVNGVAYVGLTQDANGRVTHVALKRSAGNELLDREAIAFAQGLRRLPAPPQDIQGTEFVVPVVFRCS